MTVTQPKSQQTPEGKVYRAKVTGRHAITLPAELCRQLGIEVGDSVELQQRGGRAILRKHEDANQAAIPPARGIMRGMFKDWADIQRFVAEERASWGDAPEDDDSTVPGE